MRDPEHRWTAEEKRHTFEVEDQKVAEWFLGLNYVEQDEWIQKKLGDENAVVEGLEYGPFGDGPSTTLKIRYVTLE